MNKLCLSQTLVKNAVVLDHEPFHSKEEMFEMMADKFLEAGIISNKQSYINALEYRESIGSTYMGNMIGMPHGKCDEVLKSGIGFCRLKEPFVYESHGESGEVKYIFMLAIPGSQSGEEYMRVLANLAGLLVHDDFLQILSKCTDYDNLIENIENYNK